MSEYIIAWFKSWSIVATWRPGAIIQPLPTSRKYSSQSQGPAHCNVAANPHLFGSCDQIARWNDSTEVETGTQDLLNATMTKWFSYVRLLDYQVKHISVEEWWQRCFIMMWHRAQWPCWGWRRGRRQFRRRTVLNSSFISRMWSTLLTQSTDLSSWSRLWGRCSHSWTLPGNIAQTERHDGPAISTAAKVVPFLSCLWWAPVQAKPKMSAASSSNLILVASKQPMIRSPDGKRYMGMSLKDSRGGTIALYVELNGLGESWG